MITLYSYITTSISGGRYGLGSDNMTYYVCTVLNGACNMMLTFELSKALF